MLKKDSYFYFSVNYFKTETHALVKDKFWFKARPVGVNKLNTIMIDMTQAAGISGKQTMVVEKLCFKKLQDSGLPPNQIIQIPATKTYIQSIVVVLFERNKWGTFHIFFLRHPKPLPATCRLNTS